MQVKVDNFHLVFSTMQQNVTNREHNLTTSEPRYLLFYSADCKYTAAIRQRLEMPHFSIVTKIFTTQRLTRGKSVLRLFDDILGGVHCKLENYGFRA